MTNQEMVDLYKALQNCGQLQGFKFAYAVTKNLDKLEVEIKKLQEKLQPTEELKKYDSERIALAKKHSNKNEQGEPQISNGQYDIKDKDKFNKELEKLMTKYKKHIDNYKKQLDEYNKLLKEGSCFEPHKIKKEDIPDSITVDLYAGIKSIVE